MNVTVASTYVLEQMSTSMGINTHDLLNKVVMMESMLDSIQIHI
jgi:hypothetical protein